jgi:predicted nucleic acid-binding protein
MKTLLDTDTFSEILKAKHPQVRRRAEQYLSEHGTFTISVITVLEVVSGVRRSGTPERLAAFIERLGTVEVLECDRVAAEISGNIYADLARNGRPIGLADTIIAGIAIRHGLPLATGNRAHFGFIRDAGYQLETVDWKLPPG